MPDLNSLMNDIPTDITEAENTNEFEQEVKDTEEVVEDENDIEEVDNDDSTTDSDTDDPEETDESDEEPEDDNDDYFTTAEVEDEKPVTPPAPATTVEEKAEADYIYENLQKISVRIVNAKDEIETVQVYGAGDLPQDFKSFASPYEQTVFSTAVSQQVIKATQLQDQYRQQQSNKQVEEYNTRENRQIAEDLRDLRGDGVFPKFKGNPGTKEFDNSDGAKEFDKVVTYMNETNDRYAAEANQGKAYRHIGFREAFELLNPNIREKSQAESKSRREVARRLKSTQGTSATKTKNNPQPVSNLRDLEEEFKIFSGSQP
jgi:hypothetical protein